MNAHNEQLWATARALRAHAPFVVIGSAALSLWHPELDERYFLPDIDLLVGDSGDALRLAAALRGREFAVSCWGEPVGAQTTPAELEGKLYLRAVRGELQLDVTYASETLEIARVLREAVTIDGLPVCPLWDVWVSKLRAARDRTLAFARQHGLSVPPGAVERSLLAR